MIDPDPIAAMPPAIEAGFAVALIMIGELRQALGMDADKADTAAHASFLFIAHARARRAEGRPIPPGDRRTAKRWLGARAGLTE